MTFGQRFARVVTDIVVRRPMLWRLFRRPLRTQFDKLAPVWDGMRRPDTLAPVEAALDRLASPPRRVLDLGTLPFADGSFDLITLGNMIPFFDELARVVTRAGRVLVAYSAGSETPIYVPPERLRKELSRRGFAEFAELSAGRGSALLAVKS